MKVRFIINPVAGGSENVKRISAAIAEVLVSTPGFFEVKVPESKGGAGFFSKEARDMGYNAVFACGGDGTINEVASPLVGSPTALGVVPAGSGNGFAMSLGIPVDIKGAISVLKRWAVREIDVGHFCERYFFSTAGIGFDALLSKRYNEGHLSSKMRGLLPYVPIALREYIRYRPEKVSIKTENMTEETTPFVLTVANTERYGGGAVIAPRALPDDGFFDVCILERPGLISAIGLWIKLMKGNIDSSGLFRYFRAQGLEITRSEKFCVHADGEPFEWGGHIIFKNLHKKLKVLV